MIACLDLEGVLLPEIWIKFAENTGIDELKITTRDIPDYSELMRARLSILKSHNLKIDDMQDVIKTLEPLEGAKEFLLWLKSEFQVIILSDTFYEFIDPLMKQLEYPTLFCHQLVIDEKGNIVDFQLRQDDQKTQDKFYIDAIRLGWSTKIFKGEIVDKINTQNAFPWLMLKSQQAKDIERFRWFSNGYIAINPNNKNQILDIRYSTLPNEIGGLWGIELSKEKANNSHVKYITNRTISKKRFKILTELLFH